MYHQIQFPEEYLDPWCAFTHEEVYTIKTALRGSLQIGVNKGIGKNYNNFLKTFPAEAERLTGYRQEYESTRRFTQTSYLPDTLSAMAKALDETVKRRGKDLKIPLWDVDLNKHDQPVLAHELSLVRIAGGNTGTVSFSNKEIMFAIRNFAPINNMNFSLEQAYEENPWELYTGAVLVLEGETATFINQNRDGIKTNESTIVFADGTTTPPHDKPFRFLKRGMLIFTNS